MRYLKIIKNEKLYSTTQESPISTKFRKSRLALFGHIIRLDPNNPAQGAIKYYVTPHKCPVGRPPLTWMALITKDLQSTLTHYKIKSPLNPLSLQILSEIGKDKAQWRLEGAWREIFEKLHISQWYMVKICIGSMKTSFSILREHKLTKSLSCLFSTSTDTILCDISASCCFRCCTSRWRTSFCSRTFFRFILIGLAVAIGATSAVLLAWLEASGKWDVQLNVKIWFINIIMCQAMISVNRPSQRPVCEQHLYD